MAHRARFSAAVLPVILAGALAFTACGGAKTAASGKRPSTTARLQIVQPAASATVPSPVHVVLNVTGGTIAPPTETKLAANRGHIHLSVDKKLVSMNYSTEQDLPGLAPGLHTLEAEFVAADHAPFSNRVIAAVIFRVQ
jgi:hypothetical protein